MGQLQVLLQREQLHARSGHPALTLLLRARVCAGVSARASGARCSRPGLGSIKVLRSWQRLLGCVSFLQPVSKHAHLSAQDLDVLPGSPFATSGQRPAPAPMAATRALHQHRQQYGQHLAGASVPSAAACEAGAL
jgi:hypothetical protein